MWDFPHLVQLKKAKNALKKGRVDEAFTITKDPSLREYRQCQDLLEQIAETLVTRAREHLEANRNDDALADLSRAQEAGGQRTDIAELREEALARRSAKRRERVEAENVVVSVRGHLDAGRLTAGARRLEQGRPAARSEEEKEQKLDPEVERLERELKRRRFEADQACLQIGRLLDEGNAEAAIESAAVLCRTAAEEPQTQVLLEKISGECEKAVSRAFDQGILSKARRLLRKLEGLRAPGFGYERWSEVLGECEKAGAGIARGDWAKARVYLGRLRRLLPDATWVAEAEEHARAAEDAIRGLEASPLGTFASKSGASAEEESFESPFARAEEPPVEAPKETIAAAPPAPPSVNTDQFVLWVDGAGSFLLAGGERLTIGRLGSSASPDIALHADLEGVHAELLRVDHDYFVVARGKTLVNGKSVVRRLLQDGDKINLGGQVELSFRLPTSLSATAVIDLPRGQRLENDVRRILLQDGHVIVGATTACHIVTPHAPERTILSRESTGGSEEGFTCRNKNGVIVDGKEKGRSASVPLGAQIEAGDLSFTITPTLPRGGTKAFRRGGVL